MKKVFFVVTAIMLAVLVAGCDENTSDQPKVGSNVVGYTEDGRAIMELEVGVGNKSHARALNKLIAEGVADFYEVIFYDNGSVASPVRPFAIYRTNWREGKVAKLRVPSGVTYDNASGDNHGYAYIFAGKYSDRTLLGIGTLKLVKEGSSTISGKTITQTTTEVEFLLEALETDVTGFNVANTTATPPERVSTFQQKTPTAFDATLITIDEIKVPVFRIAESISFTDFEFNVTGSTLLSAGVIKVADKPTGTNRAFLWEENSTVPPTKLKEVNFPALDLPAAVDAPLVFPFDVRLTPEITNSKKAPGVKADPGLCKIFISIPIYLYNKGSEKNGKPAETWYFRGGANNTLVDYGYDVPSSGGAILIAVGPALGEAGAITITPTW